MRNNKTGGYRGLFYKEKIKSSIYSLILQKAGRLQTPMLQIKNQLKLKEYWKKDMHCLEMFGMFGLWNTIYYIDDVAHVDFFELNKNIIKYAKMNLRKRNIDYFCEDSIQYLMTTDKTYDFIFSDVPYELNIYNKEYGFPTYTESAINHLNPGGIFVTNMDNYAIKNFKQTRLFLESISQNGIEDIFVVSTEGLIKKEIPTSLLCIVIG